MKKLNLGLISLLAVSTNLFAEVAWIGEASVKSINAYTKNDENRPCNKDNLCLSITFDAGAKHCSSAVLSLDPNTSKFIESMILVSATSNKKIKILANSQHCNNPKKLKPQKIELY